MAEGAAFSVPDDRFVLSDLSDLAQLTAAFDDIDVVIHLAADPSGSRGWDSILNSNIIATYNVLEASRDAGVSRVVFASTIQVNSGHRASEPYRSIAEGRFDDVPADLPIVTADTPARPTNVYASSKIWGEGIARAYADVHGLSCLCIRVGWVMAADRVPKPLAADIWCSQRDIVQIIECCVNASTDLKYGILYGMSDNAHRWVDISGAREAVGYVPQDRAEEHLA